MSQPCPNCGTLNLDSYRFCSNCGELLRPGEDANATPPMSSSSPAPGSASGETTSPLTASHMIPPSAPVGPEPAPAASMSQPEQPSAGGEQPAFPAYAVKTSPDAETPSSQAPTTPMGGFVPPAPGGGVYSQPAAPQQPSPYAGYQAYGSTSSTPASGGGGVYAPYAPGSPQAAALEKPKETRSWLVPVVVVAALLLVGLAAIGI